MTDQIREAALDFLRLAIENPKDHGHYAIDKNGAVYWYGERPDTSSGEECWKTEWGAKIPNEMQKILLWDSLVFSAKEVSPTPAEPPRSAPAPSPKMGRFDMERFKAGEFAYADMCSIYYRYLGTLSGSGLIVCAKARYPNIGTEETTNVSPCTLEQITKMPVKTKKVYIELWLDNSGHFFTLCKDQSSEKVGAVTRSGDFKKTLIEIIEREVEI